MASTIFETGHAALVSKLKATRIAARMTQAEVGKKIGKSQSFISLIERGQRRVDVIEFIAIGRAMGADIAGLFASISSNHQE